MAKKGDKAKKKGTRRVGDLAPKANRAARISGGGIDPSPFRVSRAGALPSLPQQSQQRT